MHKKGKKKQTTTGKVIVPKMEKVPEKGTGIPKVEKEKEKGKEIPQTKEEKGNLHGGNKIIPQTGIIEIPTKTHLNM